jgi:hypothetical protein
MTEIIQPPGYIQGCLPRDDTIGERFVASGTELDYPREKWVELASSNRSLGVLAQRVYDQGPEGQCNLAAVCAVWWLDMVRNFGAKALPPDGLSANVMYKEMVRSPSQGTTISSGLLKMRDDGTLPLDTPANRKWMLERDINPEHVGPEANFRKRNPTGPDVNRTRGLFRIRDAVDCAKASHIIGGLIENKPGVIGIDGHAMCAIDFRAWGKKVHIDCLNSWGKQDEPLGPPPAIQWGRRRIDYQRLAAQFSGYGAWICEAARESDIFS